ncbi:MAG: serine/threonine-protein kinase [Planctomycetota bacterium]
MSETNPNDDAIDPDEPNASSETSVPRVGETAGSSPQPSSRAPSLVGSPVAGYLVLSRLGRGGMADVYSARDLNLERDVAIKVLRPDLARDRDYISRFRREAKAAAKLNHPNIVQIYEVGEDDGRHYIAQELILGKNLKEYLESNGSLTPEQACEVLVGVASALSAASQQGITHRDIKPENVMWARSGEIKVADFGLARLGDDVESSRADLTQAGFTLGTPRYMSPEQVQGRPVDPRSDLYSLGVMMYHLVTGRPPFEADDPLALAFAHVNETPVPIDRAKGNQSTPEWLIAIITKLMRKSPAERFQSAAELLVAITGDETSSHSGVRKLAGAAAATARLQRVADEESRLRVRRRFQIAAASCLLAICLGAGFLVTRQVRGRNVADLVRPDAITRMDSVEEQFLEAARQNEPWAWKAVAEYFPPSSSAKNRAYASKAALQLANLYLERNRPRDAEMWLRNWMNENLIDEKYRLIGWAIRARAADATGRTREAQEAKDQVNSMHAELTASNPKAIELFNQVIGVDERVDLGLESAPNQTSRSSVQMRR